MPSLSDRQHEIATIAEELRRRHRIPGVVVSAYDGSDTATVASGYANVRERIEFTTDTTFLIGSITKVWTSTLVMQLEAAGLLSLDEPLAAYLPALDLRGREKHLTLRHLLSHTSGVTGDHFLDTGRGDEAVGAYVDRAREFGFLHEPDEMFSYCNTGFVIAGRILEVVTSKPFNRLLTEALIEPLGLTRTFTIPEQAMLFRTAVGHHDDGPPGSDVGWATWTYPLSMTPAGTGLGCSAEDLLRFGRLHLDSGRTTAGEELLAAAAVKQMQQPHATIPYPDYGRIGLGWMILDGYGTPCIGHGGGSPGGLDWLLVLPERKFALAWFANCDADDRATEFGRDLARFMFREVAGVSTPEPPRVNEPVPQELAPYAGTYQHADMTHTFVDRGDHLAVHGSGTSHIAPFARYEFSGIKLVPVGGSYFAEIDDAGTVKRPRYNFMQPAADGRTKYVHFGYRAFRRAA